MILETWCPKAPVSQGGPAGTQVEGKSFWRTWLHWLISYIVEKQLVLGWLQRNLLTCSGCGHIRTTERRTCRTSWVERSPCPIVAVEQVKNRHRQNLTIFHWNITNQWHCVGHRCTNWYQDWAFSNLGKLGDGLGPKFNQIWNTVARG